MFPLWPNILSFWPSLFDYGFIAPLVLRLALGVSLLALYRATWRSARGFLGSIAGISTIVGLAVQPISLFIILLLVEKLWSKPEERLIALPLLAIALALLLLGPGLFAFDLPL